MGGDALKCKVQAVKCKQSATKSASNKVQAELKINLGAECKPFPFLFGGVQADRVQAECKLKCKQTRGQSASRVQADFGISQARECKQKCKPSASRKIMRTCAYIRAWARAGGRVCTCVRVGGRAGVRAWVCIGAGAYTRGRARMCARA